MTNLTQQNSHKILAIPQTTPQNFAEIKTELEDLPEENISNFHSQYIENHCYTPDPDKFKIELDEVKLSPNKKEEKSAEANASKQITYCKKTEKNALKHQENEEVEFINVNEASNPFEIALDSLDYSNNQKTSPNKRKSNKNKGFPCSLCPRRLGNKQNLKKHMSSHAGKKNFECNICREPFFLKKCLIDHRKIHGKKNMHICEFCDKGFGSRSGYYKHKDTVHKEEVEKGEIGRMLALGDVEEGKIGGMLITGDVKEGKIGGMLDIGDVEESKIGGMLKLCDAEENKIGRMFYLNDVEERKIFGEC